MAAGRRTCSTSTGLALLVRCGLLAAFAACGTSCLPFGYLGPPRMFKERHRQRSAYSIQKIDLSGVVGWKYRRVDGRIGRIGTDVMGDPATHIDVDWQGCDKLVLLTGPADRWATPRAPVRVWVLDLGGSREVFDVPKVPAEGTTEGAVVRARFAESLREDVEAGEAFRRHLVGEGYTWGPGDTIRIDLQLRGRAVNGKGAGCYLCSVERSEVAPMYRDTRARLTYGIFCVQEKTFEAMSIQDFKPGAMDDTRRTTPVLAVDAGRKAAIVSRGSSTIPLDSTLWLLRLSDWKAVKLVDDNYEFMTCRLSPDGGKLMYLCRSRYSGYISDDFGGGPGERSYPPEMYVIDLSRPYADLDSDKPVDFTVVDPGFRPAEPASSTTQDARERAGQHDSPSDDRR